MLSLSRRVAAVRFTPTPWCGSEDACSLVYARAATSQVPSLAPRVLAGAVRNHCQVPCGIFDDPARVDALKEDAATVRKAMVQINELGTGSSLALNQASATRHMLPLALPRHIDTDTTPSL